MKLTEVQHFALGRSRRKAGVPISGPRKNADGVREIPEGHISPQTAKVLIAEGLAMIVEGALRITKAGEREFERVRPEGPGTFLDRNPARPLTHTLINAAPDEPEVMFPGRDWADRAESHRKRAAADVDATRLSGLPHPEDRLRELRLMAAERGVDVKEELRYVAHSLKILERKVKREAA